VPLNICVRTMSSPAPNGIVIDGKMVSFVDSLIENQYGTNEGSITTFEAWELGGFNQYGTNEGSINEFKARELGGFDQYGTNIGRFPQSSFERLFKTTPVKNSGISKRLARTKQSKRSV
jgi:hypothetical protein